jgi:hypothetical protein
MKSEKPAKKKKPYQKPAIVSREKIEGRANVCDPTIGGKATAPQCGVARS